MWLPATTKVEQDGQDNRDHDPLEDSEHDHAQAGHERQHQRALADPGVANEHVQVEQEEAHAIRTAASADWGRSDRRELKNRRRTVTTPAPTTEES